MKKEDILHLGELARIRITDAEVDGLTKDITAILEYVSQIDAVVPEGALEKQVGAVYNVLREDDITNEPGSYTDALVAEMPETHNNMLRVKKILDGKK